MNHEFGTGNRGRSREKISEGRAMLQRKEELGCSLASGRTKDLGKL